MKGSASKAEAKIRDSSDTQLITEAIHLADAKDDMDGLTRGLRTRARRVLAEARKRGLHTALEKAVPQPGDDKLIELLQSSAVKFEVEIDPEKLHAFVGALLDHWDTPEGNAAFEEFNREMEEDGE